MPLITLRGVHVAVGGPPLLERADFQLEPGERVAVVGRNGAGKSTFLRLLAGEVRPDDGEVPRDPGLRVAMLTQEIPQDLEGSVFEIVAAGLGDLGSLLAEYHRLSHAAPDDLDTAALAAVQARIEAVHGWDLERRVAQTLARLDLPDAPDFTALSGGMKRRVLLARALLGDPQVLLLDEPTNHLDIVAIEGLEALLRGFAGSVVFVTHDRRFLSALATRIVEIERGRLTSWPGDWANYLRRREERLHAEAQENARFDKLLAQEEVWIRQGIKARRTRDEGRVRRLEAMRRERARRREPTGTARLQIADAVASGWRVVEVRDVDFAWQGRPVLRGFSTAIQRGDRVGIIGPNGSGKTTLLRILLGDLVPQAGEIRLGTNLEVAYFDQQRAVLREEASALDNVAEGREYIELGGRRQHVLGYLQDFLFAPDRARAPITRLSGGERNRLLLAKLFAAPSNLLVLDEPTNDLDMETLDLLEERLLDYAGTILLVSHDRDFLDRVVTSTLVLEGEGTVGEYVGGYSDWLRQREPPSAPVASRSPAIAQEVPAARSAPGSTPAAGRRKLSYRESRELEALPVRIEALEARLAELTAAMQEPAFYRRDAAAVTAANAELAATQGELDAAYRRWEELESG